MKRIILITASFHNQTLSAVAWFIANKVDISWFELSQMKIGDNYFIDINRILPPPALEDFYVEVDDKKRLLYSEQRNTPITRSYLPRRDKLFEWGIIKAGDIVVIKNFNNSEATVINTKIVEYNGQKRSFNQ